MARLISSSCCELILCCCVVVCSAVTHGKMARRSAGDAGDAGDARGRKRTLHRTTSLQASTTLLHPLFYLVCPSYLLISSFHLHIIRIFVCVITLCCHLYMLFAYISFVSYTHACSLACLLRACPLPCVSPARPLRVPCASPACPLRVPCVSLSSLSSLSHPFLTCNAGPQ